MLAMSNKEEIFLFPSETPDDLKHIFAKNEFKYLLGRIPLQDARILSSLTASTSKIYFKQIRAGQ